MAIRLSFAELAETKLMPPARSDRAFAALEGSEHTLIPTKQLSISS